ncbi:hypothetical protein NA78x_004880 [Anatilimnocola sp. NA78]|uniref:hypothetical protein n=1 Tax=Anatilimnocola sp. NA78 TaxID=3415683 RepID=UPI003CE47C09
MKAPKISLDSAKIQQMLLLHVEKIVLGIVLLAVIWFVYQGASLTSLDNAKTPDDLIQKSNSVTTQINDPGHTPLIVEEIKPIVTKPITTLVKQGQEANDPVGYRLRNAWKTPDYPKAIARNDPRIFAPEHLKVVALHGPIALLSQTGVNGIPEVDPIIGSSGGIPGMEGPGGPGGPAPAVRQPTRPGRAPGGPGPGPGPSGEGRQPRNKRGGGAAMLEQEMMGMQEGMPAGFGPGGEGMGMPGVRTLPPEAQVGFHPSGEVSRREAAAVVVMAAVPLQKQLEEYEAAFKEALDYDPMRDLPRYILYTVERADVTDNPAQDPATARWEELRFGKAITDMNTWAPSPAEVVDPNSLGDPMRMTHRVPPFMQREIYEALLHPDIPKAQIPAAGMGPGMEGPGGVDGNGMPIPRAITEDDLTGGGTGLPGAGAGMMGEGRMPYGNPGMMQPGMMQPGMMQPGMMQPGGFGEGMPGGGSPGMVLAKYKLLRFTDTTVQPLRKYRYRVKLLVEDPNNPWAEIAPPAWEPTRSQPFHKPPVQSLNPNVFTRVKSVEGGRRAYVRESEYSEPSEIVELPEVVHYFAGKAIPAAGAPVKKDTPPVTTTQPAATILTVDFDKEKAVDVAAEKDVFRGTLLNFEKEVDVVHPSKLSIHPIGKYTFRTGSIVVDFTGGSEIPVVDKRSEKIQEPSEILVFDGSGNLKMLDETDDIEGFRRYLPPAPEAPPTNTPGGFSPDGAPVPGDGLLDGPGPRQPRNRRGAGAQP